MIQYIKNIFGIWND